ncbi:MDR family MFS transporter [Paenibacillus sp. FSL R5-0887]|uniref:MFS transporter n=1 Tax=Paenibacillus odorifer TaxID=189426 RepID=A0ABX3GUF1_9BACL|nr:MDR family MFS transporter [Paenibacillus odorifer]OMC72742.1 MFS transporter [Paenibacillus odorifer]OMD37496.1 MFS transporter [Paenibacillus odorifer]
MIMESTSTVQVKRPALMAFSLMLGAFVGLFSETALNMAFTNLMDEFSINASTVQWLTTGYLLVLGILVPISALLMQWFTTRQLFTASLLLSIVGTLIAALSPNFTSLLIARLVQALGTGLLLPLMTNIILIIFPAHKRGTVMGMMGLVIMCAPALGPTLSGLIVDHLGWEYIFWISLPLLLFTLGFGLTFIKNVANITKPKIDVLSILLSTLGFGGIVFGFSNFADHSLSEIIVLLPLIIGFISLILFVLRQFKLETPMLNLRVFKYPMFTIGLIMLFLGMMIILSSAILLPLYLKGGLLLSATMAGTLLLPGSVINGAMAPVTGRVFDKYGPKLLLPLGFFIATIAGFLFTRNSTETSSLTFILIHCAMFIGLAMVIMPAQTNGLNQLPVKYYPDGAAVMSTLQQIAGALGTTFAVTLMSSGQTRFANTHPTAAQPEILTAGITHAYLFIAAIAGIGLIISLFVKRIRVY